MKDNVSENEVTAFRAAVKRVEDCLAFYRATKARKIPDQELLAAKRDELGGLQDNYKPDAPKESREALCQRFNLLSAECVLLGGWVSQASFREGPAETAVGVAVGLASTLLFELCDVREPERACGWLQFSRHPGGGEGAAMQFLSATESVLSRKLPPMPKPIPQDYISQRGREVEEQLARQRGA